MGANDSRLWCLNDDESWDGSNRRRSPRLYIPAGCLALTLVTANGQSRPFSITNLSQTGIGGSLELGHPVQEGMSVELRDAGSLSFQGQVIRVGVLDIGIVTADKAALMSLHNSVKSEKVTLLHHRDSEIYVEGYLGYAAHAEMRKSHEFSLIDLSRVTGMDVFGLGILMHHIEKGTKIGGCRGAIRNILKGANFCKRCHPHNPPTDCPAHQRTRSEESAANCRG